MSDGNVKLVEIDGAKYTVIKLPAKTAWLLKFKIGKILGPRLSDLVKLAAAESKKKAKAVEGEEQSAEDLKNESVVGAVDIFGKFLADLNPEEALDLLVTLCSHAKKAGDDITSDNFNQMFAESDMTAMKVAIEVFKLNFVGFSNAVAKSSLGQKMASMVSPS